MARQYYKDSTTGQMKPLGVKVEDTLPVGTIVEYNGQNIPEGWVDIGNGKIEKEYQVIPTNALLENGDSDSATNGYVAEYINNHSVVVSPTEPSGSARKKVWLQHTENLLDNRESKVYGPDTKLEAISTGIRATALTTNASSFATIDIGALSDFVGEKIYVKFTKTSATNNGKIYIGKANADHTSRSIIAMSEDLSENGDYEFNTDTIVTDSSKPRLIIAIYSNGSGQQVTVNSYVDYTNLIVSTENIPYEPYVEDKEYILNNNVYEEFNPNKEEVIDITSLSGGATINTTYWRNRLVKQGKICHLELAFAPNSTSNITILQLPAGFYSSGNTATIGLLMRNSLLGKMVITNGGAVQVQVGSESGNTWSLNATWIVD